MEKALLMLTIFLFLAFGLPYIFPAQAQCIITFPGDLATLGFNCNLNNPGNIISVFLPSILGIAGFITVIVIVISGIQFITSSGNPETAGAARGRLTFALVGFALIVLAFTILQIINRIFLRTQIT